MESEHAYNDSAYEDLARELDALAAAGAGEAARVRFIEKVHVTRNRAIRDLDFRALDPGSVADDYLLPRKDLSRFVVESWVRHVCLGRLGARLADRLLVFGLGRLFSAYNDLGAQHCTDVDLNVIAEDGLSAKDLAAVSAELARLRGELHERFAVVLELHPDFTLLRERAVLKALEDPDPKRRFATSLFYRANERGIRVLKDHPAIRERVFSKVRRLPDAALFEHFLGLGASGPTFAKLRTGAPLPVGLDGTCDKALAVDVVGSRAFALRWRKLFPQGLFVSPPEWHFSMKYFVNRVYDYVCAMRMSGHGLDELGFDGPGPDGVDPDYRWLRNAHKLMLHLQELVQAHIGAFGVDVDYGWMSATRFRRLAEIGGERFVADFDAMVLDGALLKASEVARYRELRRKIATRANDRVLEGRASDRAKFPVGFRYENLNADEGRYRIRVPFHWGDLAFFAFSAIAARVARVVESRILPALPRLGMPRKDLEAYLKVFGS
ncbi:MAG: hypothetical protein JXA15_12300 [Spirochaetales bacterium]|nr:hypothetical protein [Spirochaetales bacterium]